MSMKRKAHLQGVKIQLFRGPWRKKISPYCENHQHQLSRQFLREGIVGGEKEKGTNVASHTGGSNPQYTGRCMLTHYNLLMF